MGQDIENSKFHHADFNTFHDVLVAETALLEELFEQKQFISSRPVGGYELEAWLLDKKTLPAAINQKFLENLSNPLVVHELSQFNVELNSEPHVLGGKVFSLMQSELTDLWKSCTDTATALNAQMVMIGTLPVLDDTDLAVANMSKIERYRALNEQVLRLRKGTPIKLDIQGHDHLQSCHHDVMLEAAATSFQIHLQVNAEYAARYYNASVLASAPLLAITANSPFVFGKDLWAESRIPLFEQAVNTNKDVALEHSGYARVTFGHDWCKESIFELFAENLSLYPILLPTLNEAEKDELWHLRLHNGTIWRWNRPLIGIDENGYHLRIEQRVIPAGPTIIDMIANAALYYGLVTYLANEKIAPESLLEFSQVKKDFYSVAEHGLQTDISWPDQGQVNVRELLVEDLLPAARTGLSMLSIDKTDIDYYLGVIQARLESGQTGSNWQRSYMYKHQCSMREMTVAYIKNQQSFKPVHEWAI